MSVRDLETAVTRLSKEELASFSKWFEEYVADERVRQIEVDIHAGRFNAVGKRAKADYGTLLNLAKHEYNRDTVV